MAKWYSEAEFARAAGVSRVAIKNLREKHLRKRVDWRRRWKVGIELSERGVTKLREALDLPFEEAVDLLEERLVQPEKNVVTGGLDIWPQSMKVVRIPVNPMMVCGKWTKFNGEIHNCPERLVYVGRNENYVVGDEIEVVPHGTQAGIWKCVSPLPRDRRRMPKV